MSLSQQELVLDDDVFALLDGVDLVVSAFDTSSFTSSSSASGHEHSNDSEDGGLFAIFADSEPGEFGADWDASPPLVQHVEHQDELSSQPAVAQATKSHSNKSTKSEKTVTLAGKNSTTAAKPAAAVKRLRKHNKTEIFKLRKQVGELQVQHSSLLTTQKRQRSASGFAFTSIVVAAQYKTTANLTKQHSSGLTTALASARPCSLWCEHAAKQYQRLQESETLNRRLRDAVTQQLKVTNSIQALFHKTLPHHEVELLLQVPVVNQYPREGMLRTLHSNIERQYHETDVVCHRIGHFGDTSSAFTICQAKQDAECGPTYEFTMNTPVAHCFQTAERLLWSWIIECKGSRGVRLVDELEQNQKHFSRADHEKRVELTVPSRYGEFFVEGAVAIRKFEDERRIVITVASAYSVRDTSVTIRADSWILVSQETSSAATSGSLTQLNPAALVQIYLRIYSDQQTSTSLPEPPVKTKYIQETVAEALGDHMQEHVKELITVLV